MPSKEVLTFWLDMAAPMWLLSRVIVRLRPKGSHEASNVVRTGSATLRRMAARQFAAILAVTLLVGACGEAPPSGDAAASVDPTCVADVAMTGGFEGHVSGPVTAAPRRIGSRGRGVSIDAFLDMPQDAIPTRFMLSVFDGDGPEEPGAVSVTFAEIEPGLTTFGWTEGIHPGRVSLADDGSNAVFDLELSALGVTPAVHLTGSFDCPPLP